MIESDVYMYPNKPIVRPDTINQIVRYVMQSTCCAMPCCRALRTGALVLTVILGVEWTAPLGGFAQPNTESASTPAVSDGNQDLPTIQETEVTEERKPFYKTWWFWTLVAVVLTGVVVVAVIAGSAGSDDCILGGLCAPPPQR